MPDNDAFWRLFEKRFIELDAILDDDDYRPMYERAEAHARRDELGRAWHLVQQAVATDA